MAAGRAVAATVRFGGGPEPGPGELIEAPVRWPRPEELAAGLTSVKGVGPVFGELAAGAGVNDLFDLLWRLPGDYSEPPPAATLESLGEGDETEVHGVEHQFDAHEHDERIATHQDADGTDTEQHGGQDEVPRGGGSGGEQTHDSPFPDLIRRVSMTVPTTATTRRTEVSSNATT